VGLPRGVQDLFDKAKNGTWGAITPVLMVGLVVFMIAVVAFIVYVERCERRIPVQYAKRVVGRQSDGRAIHAPAFARERRRRYAGHLCIFYSGFAARCLVISLKNSRYFGDMIRMLGLGAEPLYTVLYALGIIFFAYFYVSIVFNPSEVADNMRKYGGLFLHSSGQAHADYINEVLTRITLVGALYLIIISFIPEWMMAGIH